MEVIQRSTSVALAIPQEIIDYILDFFLALNFSHPFPSPDDLSLRNLAAIATTSQAFVIPVQKHLFSKRRLDTGTDYTFYNEFLSRKPHIANYTQNLTLALHDAERSGRVATVLAEVLQNFTSVQHFKVEGIAVNSEVCWRTVNSNLKSSILYISRLLTLKSLRLVAINNFHFSDLKPSSLGQMLILSRVTGAEDKNEALPVPHLKRDPPEALGHVVGYFGLTIDRVNIKAWEQIVGTSSLSISRLEVSYPTTPLYINLSELPLLHALKLRVWHTFIRGGETTLSTILRSAGVMSSIGDLDCTILIFHPTALRGACAGLDAVLSGSKYLKLRRFSLHITTMPFTAATILQATGNENLEDYYRQELPGLVSRGVLSLEVTASSH
ncbi:hypothetical protein BDZ94DRAFT_219548 [Collybia nuda]|uniref:Uncharacterized protein n=1 Tax=Collybia nuda TaxID=64659 RepID=A0A9P5YDC6_9AGAR|nr:hypothetical protein BDZ94DRAFT_219548 [Collybia nuda]